MKAVDEFRSLLSGGGRIHGGGERLASAIVVERAARLDRASRRGLQGLDIDRIPPDGPTAVLAWSGRHGCYLVAPRMTERETARQAASSRPDLLVVDDKSAASAKWAAANGIGIALLGGGEELTIPAGVSASSSSTGIGFYTSGSTGSPTPVLHSIAAVTTAASTVANRLGLTGDDTALAASPVHHTLGFVTNLITPLTTGGDVVPVRPREAGSLIGSSADDRVSWCASTPAVLAFLAQMCRHLDVRMPRLRLVRSSGAPLKERAARSLRAEFGVSVVNAYAMTEAPGEICSQEVGRAPVRLDSVGVPTGAQVRLSPRVDLGERNGDIRVRGPAVAEEPSDESGWLSTKDIGMWCDGELVVKGRSDDLINCGGEKVVPQEIEAVAERHPAISEAFVFPMPAGDYGTKIGLAVDVADGTVPEAAEIVRFLSADLSSHKLPVLVTPLHGASRSSRGKLNRRTFHMHVPRSRTPNAK